MRNIYQKIHNWILNKKQPFKIIQKCRLDGFIHYGAFKVKNENNPNDIRIIKIFESTYELYNLYDDIYIY